MGLKPREGGKHAVKGRLQGLCEAIGAEPRHPHLPKGRNNVPYGKETFREAGFKAPVTTIKKAVNTLVSPPNEGYAVFLKTPHGLHRPEIGQGEPNWFPTEAKAKKYAAEIKDSKHKEIHIKKREGVLKSKDVGKLHVTVEHDNHERYWWVIYGPDGNTIEEGKPGTDMTAEFQKGISAAKKHAKDLRMESFKEAVDAYGDQIKVGSKVVHKNYHSYGKGKIIKLSPEGKWVTVKWSDPEHPGKTKLSNLMIELNESFKEAKDFAGNNIRVGKRGIMLAPDTGTAGLVDKDGIIKRVSGNKVTIKCDDGTYTVDADEIMMERFKEGLYEDAVKFIKTHTADDGDKGVKALAKKHGVSEDEAGDAMSKAIKKLHPRGFKEAWGRCSCGVQMTPNNKGCRYKHVKTKEGKKLKRIPYDGGHGGKDGCADCNVKKGGIHHLNCDVERDPRGGQMLGADYPAFTEATSSDKRVLVKKGYHKGMFGLNIQEWDGFFQKFKTRKIGSFKGTRDELIKNLEKKFPKHRIEFESFREDSTIKGLIRELPRLYDKVTTSDLQGIVAVKVGKLIQKGVVNRKKKDEAEDILLQHASGDMNINEAQRFLLDMKESTSNRLENLKETLSEYGFKKHQARKAPSDWDIPKGYDPDEVDAAYKTLVNERGFDSAGFTEFEAFAQAAKDNGLLRNKKEKIKIQINKLEGRMDKYYFNEKKSGKRASNLQGKLNKLYKEMAILTESHIKCDSNFHAIEIQRILRGGGIDAEADIEAEVKGDKVYFPKSAEGRVISVLQKLQGLTPLIHQESIKVRFKEEQYSVPYKREAAPKETWYAIADKLKSLYPDKTEQSINSATGVIWYKWMPKHGEEVTDDSITRAAEDIGFSKWRESLKALHEQISPVDVIPNVNDPEEPGKPKFRMPDVQIPEALNTKVKKIAEEASEAWADSRNFDEQWKFMGEAEKAGAKKNDYTNALSNHNAWSLIDWVKKNWGVTGKIVRNKRR